ncbi:MAG: VOC family protein [Bacteroidota bacterium]|nr:VOC family protein [Bacteroidota bacterium]
MKFRFARHSNNIYKLQKFYSEILGFETIGHFQDHKNYNGIFLGLPNSEWHLEFTESNEKANHTFDEDDILVFYPESQNEYDQYIKTIKENKIDIIESKNPFWKTNGIMFLDPDGYRIVISNNKVVI